MVSWERENGTRKRCWRGFTYTAFVIDVFARRILGLVVRVAHCSAVRPWGSQYLSIRYTDRLAEVEITPSVGSAGDSYENAMAESIIGLYETEMTRQHGPRKSIDAVEIATLDWVDWYNNRRIMEPIGYRSPREAEIEYYQERMRTVDPVGLIHRAGLAEGKHAIIQPLR